MILVLLVAGAIIGLIYYFKNMKTQRKAAPPKQEVKPEIKETKRKPSDTTQQSNQTSSSKSLKSQEHELKKNQKKIKKTNPTHPCFLRGFKGFKDRIADFDVSSDGKYVVACSPDNTFRVYRPKDLNDQDPLMVYQKIDFYEPSVISLRHDKRQVAIGMGEAKMVEFYNLEEIVGDDGEKLKIKIDFQSRSPDKLHKTNLKHLFLDFDGKFFITGSDEDDTTIKAWSLSGENLGTLTTAQLKNHHVVRSPDGRFLAVGAWTSDVMILEIKTNKDGSLKSLGKAMVLKGHRQGNIDLAFNNLNDKAVTLAKDHTMKLWNINVRYEVGEDPRCLASVNIQEFEELKNLGTASKIALYTFENNSRSIAAISHGNDILVFDFQQNKVIEKITQAHSEGSDIYSIMFREHGGKPYLYSSGEDGRINMWKFGDL